MPISFDGDTEPDFISSFNGANTRGGVRRTSGVRERLRLASPRSRVTRFDFEADASA